MSFDGVNGGWLTVGQVAKLAGCSADTVRSWERDGLLPARRTPGGQRRFDEAEVQNLLKLRPRASQSTPLGPTQPKSARLSAPAPQVRPELPARTYLEPSPLEVELQDETVALEILLKQKEREEIERRSSEVQCERERRAAAERAVAQAKQRLEDLKSFGLAIARDLPTEVQAAVTADMETYVTMAHLPATLSEFDARAFVQARVERFRRRYLAKRAAEAETRRQSRERERLIEAGKSHARQGTSAWAQAEASEARVLVSDALEYEVEHDWDEPRVRRLVDEVLNEFEDELEDEDDESEDRELLD